MESLIEILQKEKECLDEIRHCERNIMINERHLNKIQEYGSDCEAYHKDVKHCESEINIWLSKKEMHERLLETYRATIKQYLIDKIKLDV
ncbi:MAG: hypothetical protein PUB32_00860 [Clostridiales bacterium]|nr:hypothetical protein [Clostridiales bacterium]